MGASETLRALHRAPPMLVLPNAWDVASARALARIPGCRALATTSGGVARALGWEDGERTPVEEMLRVVERIAAAVDVPVTADLEAGYRDPPRTAAAALAAGAAGMNLEDSRGGAVLGVDEQVELLRAIRAAAAPLVLNARIDVFLKGSGDLDEALERAAAYLAAGADCVYPIAAPRELVETLAARIDGAVNVLARPGEDLAPYAAAGVARVTFGTALARAALAEAERLAAAALASVA
jgi:2-methylisocitrate lyase-like PEP mutase family enzyme